MGGENQTYSLNFAAHATQKKSVYVLYTKHTLPAEFNGKCPDEFEDTTCKC